jgi:molybdate transport system substrate-binding protein
VAVRAGAPKPDISSVKSLREALISARSIAYSAATSGNYVAALFVRMGIAEELKPKIRLAKGEPVGALVARGDAEIGFQQISELLPVAGIDLVGPLPSEIQQVTIFSAGMHTNAREPKAATALIKFLTAPAASLVIRQSGMDPG